MRNMHKSVLSPIFFLFVEASPPPLALCRGLEAGEGRTGSEQDFIKFFFQKRSKRAVGRLRGMGGVKKKKCTRGETRTRDLLRVKQGRCVSNDVITN